MSDRDDVVLAAVAGKRANSTGWVRGNCPWCEARLGKPDRKQCLGLQTLTGGWHCFRCGSSGILGIIPEDIELLRPEVTAELTTEVKSIDPPDGFTAIYEPEHEHSLSCDEPREYLRGRGFSDDVMRAAKVGACFDGRLRGRVVVPILDAEEKHWLGWSARATWPDAERKVLYPKGMQRRHILYNHAALFAPEAGVPVLVTEACFDALSVWPHAVATLGKPTVEHFEALISSGRPIAWCLDGDAWREAEVWAMRARFEGARSGAVRMPPTKDPNTVPREVLLKAAIIAVERGCVAKMEVRRG